MLPQLTYPLTLLITIQAGGKQAERIRRFLSLLAVCHTVVVEKDADASTPVTAQTNGGASTAEHLGGKVSKVQC